MILRNTLLIKPIIDFNNDDDSMIGCTTLCLPEREPTTFERLRGFVRAIPHVWRAYMHDRAGLEEA